MELTAEQKVYLTNKHNGGVSNQKGNTFEVIYATKEIIRLFASEINLDNTLIVNQLENTFVDDLQIIYDSGLKVYHQCKDAKSLCWGKDIKGGLYYDFRCQKEYSISLREAFELKIVYSHKDCKIHTNPIPSIIKDVTIKEFFKAYQNINELLFTSEDFRSDIQSIIYTDNDGNALDQLSVFAEVIRSEWLELAFPSRIVSLSDIKKHTLAKYGKIINFKDLPNIELSSALKTIFERFPEFLYSVNGKNIFWSYKNLSGQFYLSEELQSSIIEENPFDIFELITLLN